MTMFQRWTVGDLNPDLLFEVTHNRNPETSGRFNIPIPTMLDENGHPLFSHPNIFDKSKGVGPVRQYRFAFLNPVDDDAVQGVKIDGTGSLMFMPETNQNAADIMRIAKEVIGQSTTSSPEMIETIIDRIHREPGVFDRWNENMSDLPIKYDPTDDVENGVLGRFVYKDKISSAIFISGQGAFEGVSESDQGFSKGAYIVFPELNLEAAKKAIANYDPLNPAMTKSGAKLVQPNVFMKTRRLPDGSPIVVSQSQKQVELNRKYYEVKAIAGFPDYKPEAQALEAEWLKKIEDRFSLYGYPRIKTRAIEELHILRLEEGIDHQPSQIFELRRAFEAKANDNKNKQDELGLRFDHTVPLARYIAENERQNNPLHGGIVYPFKSARIGPVWRAESDLAGGKLREFVQADIDVVGDGSVPLEYDAEFPRVMCDIAEDLGIGTIELGISNRKITKGFFDALGFDDKRTAEIIGLIEQRDVLGFRGLQDKLDKIFPHAVGVAKRCLDFAYIKSADSSFADDLFKLSKSNPLMESGIEELMEVMEKLKDIRNGTVMADLGVVRGMNYYTGTVYEGRCKSNPKYPLIVGGRYDSLVGHFMKESRPGVGASFQVTKAIELLVDSKRLDAYRNNTKLLIAFSSLTDGNHAEQLAKMFRGNGHVVELAYGLDTLEKQMKYAKEKSIPEVAIIDAGKLKLITVLNGQESLVEPAHWQPK